MKKLILGIFISLGAFFLMSHNASAVSRTIYLKNGVYAYGIPATTGGQGGSSVTPSTGEAFNIQNNVYKMPAGRIWYSMAWRLEANNSNVDLSSYTDYTFSFSYCGASNQYFSPSSNDLFRVTDYYEFEADTRTTIIGAISNNIALDQYVVEKCRNVTMKGKVGTNSYNAFQIGTTANGSFTRIFGFDYNGNFTSDKNLYIISPTVVLFDNPNEADDAIQKEKENIQNAADDSETSGSNSQNSSQGATNNLLSVFTGFANVITNASATNCVINAPLNTTFSSDRLNVDLCGLSIPPAIGALTSIIAVMAVVPFAISMFNKFIGIMQGFQR